MKAGVKNIGTVFLMTDAQVSDEKFLVLINDLLASGEIPDLFPDDEVENIIGGKRSEVRYLLQRQRQIYYLDSMGIMDKLANYRVGTPTENP